MHIREINVRMFDVGGEGVDTVKLRIEHYLDKPRQDWIVELEGIPDDAASVDHILAIRKACETPDEVIKNSVKTFIDWMRVNANASTFGEIAFNQMRDYL